MTMIAEGVETFEEAAYLQAATRIRFAQGLLLFEAGLLEELSAGAQRQRSRAPCSARKRALSVPAPAI